MKSTNNFLYTLSKTKYTYQFIIESYKQHNKRNLWEKKKLPKKKLFFMKLNWQNYSTLNIIISSFYMTKDKKIYIGTKNTEKNIDF